MTSLNDGLSEQFKTDQPDLESERKRPKLHYYVLRRKRAYFQLGLRRGRLAGMRGVYPLGYDGPKAWERAIELYRQYKAAIRPVALSPVRVPIIFIPAKPSPLLKFILDHRSHGQPECLVPPVKVIGASGYIHLKVSGRQIGAHRLMLILAKSDDYFANAWAAHKCGNPSCVNPPHLYWATPSENAQDRVLHGTVRMGKRSVTGPAV